MTKAEIVNEVAKATGIEKIAVQSVVESFMENVKDSLVKGNPVYLGKPVPPGEGYALKKNLLNGVYNQKENTCRREIQSNSKNVP